MRGDHTPRALHRGNKICAASFQTNPPSLGEKWETSKGATPDETCDIDIIIIGMILERGSFARRPSFACAAALRFGVSFLIIFAVMTLAT